MANSKTAFPFMKLPPEVRNLIYEELIIVFLPFVITVIRLNPRILGMETLDPGESMSPMSRPHPIFALFRVSKQTRQEAISVYFGGNRFNAADSDELARFLGQIGPEARNAIREVSIRYRTGKSAGKAFKLLAGCGSLRKLHFTIDSTAVAYGPGNFIPLLKRPGIPTLLKVRGIEELNAEVKLQGHGLAHSDEPLENDKEGFLHALQILKEPRHVRKKKRLPPEELSAKVPMMTRARASGKEQSR